MRRLGWILIMVVALATWLLVAAQLAPDHAALGIVYLIPFAAPGAMIGIAIGWLSHVFVPDTFTWRRGRKAASLGAALLPPWLALLVAITGMTIAGGVAIVVGGAWIVFIVGVGAAVGRWADDHFSHAGIRDRVREMARRTLQLRVRRPERRIARRLTGMFERGVLTREAVPRSEGAPGVPRAPRTSGNSEPSQAQ